MRHTTVINLHEEDYMTKNIYPEVKQTVIPREDYGWMQDVWGVPKTLSDRMAVVMLVGDETSPERVELYVTDHYLATPFAVFHPDARPTYSVIVGNIGTTYSGYCKRTAQIHANGYIDLSKRGAGRAGGESVILMETTPQGDQTILREHHGTQTEDTDG